MNDAPTIKQVVKSRLYSYMQLHGNTSWSTLQVSARFQELPVFTLQEKVTTQSTKNNFIQQTQRSVYMYTKGSGRTNTKILIKILRILSMSERLFSILQIFYLKCLLLSKK